MGKWAGIAAGIEGSEAKKEKELAEAKLDAQFTEGNRIKLLGMALKYSDKNRRSFTGGDYKVASADGKTTRKSIPPVEQSLARLVEFDIPDAALGRISGGSASDLNKIVESFISAKKKHIEEYGASNPMPNEMFVEALNNAVITQPEGYKVDVDAVLEQFGITASEAERLMFGKDVEPLANINLQAESLNIVPALSFKDLNDATKAVGMEVVRTAYGELENFRGAPQAEDAQINTWRAARIAQIESGLSKAQGDVPILTDLFGLFGNSYASQYIESQPVLDNAVKMGQFPKSYAEAAARPDLDLTAPVDGVENLAEYGQKIFKYLMQNNLVPIGTTVKFYGSDGAIGEQTVTEQLIEQFNRAQ